MPATARISKSNFNIIPVGSHTRTSVDTNQVLTLTNASGIIIQAEGGTLRYRIDGSAATTTAGLRIGTSDGERRIDLYPGSTINVIGEAAGYFVNYILFKVDEVQT